MISDQPKVNESATIYVQLLEEGSPALRRTTAISLGNGAYRLLATPDYDPEDETWEFLPGTNVEVVRTEVNGELLRVAISIAKDRST